MKPSQILRKAATGKSLAEIMLLLEPMKQTKATMTVAMFVIDEVVSKAMNCSIKEQNDFCRSLLIELAKRYEKNSN